MSISIPAKSDGWGQAITDCLTLIGMSYECKKNVHLQRHLGASFVEVNELGLIDLNFHLLKCFEIFYKNLADKNPIQKL